MKVLAKKVLFINDVDSQDGEDILTDRVGVEREIYGLFEVGPVSVREIPIGGRFFDSIEELDKELGVDYKEDDVEDFDIVLSKKKKDLTKWLTKIGYYKL